MSTIGQKIFKFLSSIQLAVIIIVSFAVIASVGTIVEARYDAEYAKKLVYYSPYMFLVMALLCTNLTFVMIDRWPWRPHHTGFVLAHIGIIILLVGSFVTYKFGLDGSMTFPIGRKERFVTVGGHELLIYSSYVGSDPSLMFSRDVDFFNKNLKDDPLIINLGKDKFSVIEYHNFAERSEEHVVSEKVTDGPALRIQLQNQNVNLLQWLHLPGGQAWRDYNLGPARIILSNGEYQYKSGNEIVLNPKDNERINYKIYLERMKGLIKEGTIAAGASVQTGWIDLSLRVLKYLPHSKYQINYTPQKKPSAFSSPALKILFNGEEHWVGLNSVMKFFTEDKIYYFSYANKRVDIGFNLHLKDFKVGRYQGTMRAASYESLVDVDNEKKDVVISMNNPLKHKGLTFYQSSFDEDESGQPRASILSVNHDPGRGLKYLGSFLIVLGSIILFYFKKMKLKPKAP